MTTTQFLDDLEKELKGHKIPRKDIATVREFYDEAIADRLDSGMSEDEAIADLGSVEDIARTTYEENPPIKKTIAGMSIPTFVLFVVLALLSSIIWGPFVLLAALLALAPLAFEGLFIGIGSFFVYISALAFIQGVGNLSAWFLMFIGIGIIGIFISLTPLFYRVTELAGRAFIHAILYFSSSADSKESTDTIAFYKPVFTWRKFDKIVLIAGGIIAAIGVLVAFGIWASVGFNIYALPPLEHVFFNGHYNNVFP